jgi:hypothetical protein
MKVSVLFSVPPTVKIAGVEKNVYRLYRRIILIEMRKQKS